VQGLHLPERPQLALAPAVELLDLVDGCLVRPEAVAPVDEHDGFGNALQVHRPVEGRVTTTDEEHPLSLELPGIEHLEIETLLLEPILALDAELPRLERPDAGGNDNGT
jgi:hypothetical protein